MHRFSCAAGFCLFVVAGAPLLLTGYQALNRLVGRDVYSSNDELGGIEVMHRNGVTHLVVKDDFEGCEAILQWLSFVPEHRRGPLPVLVNPADPVSRTIDYKPSVSTEDPRLMFTGCRDHTGRWLSGFFDHGTFREVQSEWARSCVVGRARLGGIAVGVIGVETRVTEMRIPADPAMPLSSEVTLTRAGQVLYPESAYKLAQALRDFNEEELPVFIFANWKGFSGGERDMFHEVLKFGSYIVDALVEYRQPCFVYIPPKGELRGGSWVVVDSRLNVEHMEMYGDRDCRGGVMEPSGLVEIKFRDHALREVATRLDPVLQSLAQEDSKLASEGIAVDSQRRQVLKESREKRLKELVPVYTQVALHFAELHDTAVRMRQRHAIRSIVAWAGARTFFYWRLRRQLIMFALREEITRADPQLDVQEAERTICRWTEKSGHHVDSNYQFVQWASHNLHEFNRRLQELQRRCRLQQIKRACAEDPSLFLEALKDQQPAVYAMIEASGPIPSHNPLWTERSLAALSAITCRNGEDDGKEGQ